MDYILIFWFALNTSQSITTVEFHGRLACLSAIIDLREQARDAGQELTAVCVEKGPRP